MQSLKLRKPRLPMCAPSAARRSRRMPCFAITAGHSCKQAGAAVTLTLGKGRPKLNAVLRTKEVGPKGG